MAATKAQSNPTDREAPSPLPAELTLGLRDSIEVEALALADYETSIREARSRGSHGRGSIRFPARDFCTPQKGNPDRDTKPLTFSARGAGHRDPDAVAGENHRGSSDLYGPQPANALFYSGPGGVLQPFNP